LPVQPHQPQNQEVPLKKEPSNNRWSETAVKQKPTQIRQNEQTIWTDRQREKTVVLTQTKTEKHQSTNGSNSPLASSSQKDRLSPQPSGVQLQPGPAIKEAAQEPTAGYTTHVGGTRQEQKVQRPDTVGQRGISQPRSFKEEIRSETQTVAPQPRPSTSVKGALQAPTVTQRPQVGGTGQQQTLQRPAIIGQQGVFQSGHETQQARVYNEGQRAQASSAGSQSQSRPIVREAAQTQHGDRVKQEEKAQGSAASGEHEVSRPRQETQQRDQAAGKRTGND
jgi:hypothetical protein